MADPSPPPKPRRRRRWLKRIVLAILIIPFLVIAGFGIEWKWTRVAGQRKLDAVTARLDAEDPGWRFDDIVAAHNAKVPPDAENSALKAVEIVKAFPQDSGNTERLYSNLATDRLSNELPSDEDWQELEAEYPKWETSIQALQVWSAVTPRGRIPIDDKGGNPIAIRLDSTMAMRRAEIPLAWQAIRSARLGQPGAALANSMAGLHLARSVEFEPILVAYLVRIAAGQLAMGTVSQTLAWCQNATDDDLATVQNLVWKESGDHSVKPYVRGERAYIHRTIEVLERDEFEAKEDLLSRKYWRAHSDLKHTPAIRAYCLEQFDRLMPMLDLPIANRYFAIQQFNPSVQVNSVNLGPFVFQAVKKVLEADLRYHASCLCTAAGIACERYRLKHNRWPAKLDDLAEFGIPKGLVDPFDGQPLRYAQLENGIVVYSIGTNGEDDGGEVVTRSGTPRDVGFRLWNVEARKIPKPPPPVEEFDQD